MNDTSKNNTKAVRVFISHSSKDLDIATRLVEALEARGVECWFAPRDIEFREDYAEKLIEALHSCSATLVLLSKDSVDSRHVRREIEQADALGHIFYPVRLLDVKIGSNLSYFLSLKTALDLNQSEPEDKYNTLADAINQGVALRRKQSRRRSFAIGAVLAASVAGAALVFATFSGQLADIENALPGAVSKNRTTLEASYIDQFYARTLSDTYDLSGLATLDIMVAGAGPQNPEITAEVFERTTDGTYQKIGQATGAPIFDGPDSFKISVLTLGAPDEPVLCLHLSDKPQDGDADQSYPAYFIDRNSALQQQSENISVARAADGVSCQTLLDTPADTDFNARFEAAQALAEHERDHAFVIAQNLLPFPQDANRYQVNLSEIGQSDGASRNGRQVLVFLETGPSANRWTLQDALKIQGSFRSTFRFEYRRALGDLVRLCVTTRYRRHPLYVHAETFFQRNGDNTYSAMPERSALKADRSPAYCQTSANGQSILQNIPLVSAPIDEAVPSGTAPPAAGDDRAQALSSMRRGVPQGYGYFLAGFRLGMDFDLALAQAAKLLPRAGRDTVGDINALWSSRLAYGAAIRFQDGQRYRMITLVRHADVNALAGVHLTYQSPNRPFRLLDVSTKLRDLLGAPLGVGGKDGPGIIELVWSSVSDPECHHPDPYTAAPLGVSYIGQRAGCRDGLLLGVSGNTGKVSLSLVDANAMKLRK